MKTMTLVAVLAASGCALEETDEDVVIDVDGKADGAVTLAATYALELTSSMKTEDRRESDPAKRFATLAMRARAQVKVTAGEGGGVKLAVKLCDVVLPQVSGYQPVLAPDLIASVPALNVTAKIDGEANELVTDPVALVLGAQLPNPLTDALPGATSSRLRDQDRDGNPGVSIQIPGYGSIFAALRVKLSFAGALTNVASITGAADVELDQKIYGDDIWFYDAATSAAEAEANVAVVQSSNRVKLKRDATTCAKVRTLFP